MLANYTRYGIIRLLIKRRCCKRKLVAVYENGEVLTSFEKSHKDEKISYGEILATLFCTLEASTKTLKKDLNEEESIFLSQQLEEMFGRCFYNIFPEYLNDKDAFDLCDAAIIKAQDDIIKEAEKKGVTFQEALKQYNEKAQEYVNARKMS